MASRAADSASLANTFSHTGLDSHHIFEHGAQVETEKPRGASASSTPSSSSEAAMRKKFSGSGNRAKAYSNSSRNTQSSGSIRTGESATHRPVRTLPPWIASCEEDDIPYSRPASGQLITQPNRAHAAQHNSNPANAPRRISTDGYVDDYEDVPHGPNAKKPHAGFFGNKEPVRGRKWDHARDGEPVIVQANIPGAGQVSPWAIFAKSTMYGPEPGEETHRVDEQFLIDQTPGYYRPWVGDLDGGNDEEKLSGILHSKKQRKNFMERVQRTILMHPLVPLIFRLIVLATSVIALGISASIYHLSDKYLYRQNPSTTMAIVVDVVAIPYILYVTWDEYTGAPLGLRSPKTKIRLVLLDLFFIIFESANLAIAFGALTENDGSCKMGQNGANFIICDRVKALCGILMLALIAWSMTFSVSIFRLVERVGGREEDD